MKNEKIKAGDRVKHKFFGKGTFIKELEFLSSLSLVKWDKTPDIRYNMGVNPCVVFTKELQILKEK